MKKIENRVQWFDACVGIVFVVWTTLAGIYITAYQLLREFGHPEVVVKTTECSILPTDDGYKCMPVQR